MNFDSIFQTVRRVLMPCPQIPDHLPTHFGRLAISRYPSLRQMAVSLPISSWIAGSVHLKLCTPSGLIVTAPCSGAELHGIFWAPGQIKELILKQFGDSYHGRWRVFGFRFMSRIINLRPRGAPRFNLS